MKKTTRFFALLLALIMIMSFAACGKKDRGQKNVNTEPKGVTLSADEQFAKEKAEYQAMTPEQLQEKYIKDPTAVTTEEYIALVSTLKYTDEKEDEKKGTIILEDNPTETLYKAKAFNGIDDELAFKTLAASEWAHVRGFALENAKTKLSKQKLDEIKPLFDNEKEPYVLVRLLSLIFSSDSSKPDIVNFIKRAAKDENKYVRLNAANTIGNIGKNGFDGDVELMKELMQDSDKDVKSRALINSGRLYDDSVIDILEAVLKDKSQSDLHESALNGLSYLWYDYAEHNSTNERAYRITMDYYKTAFTDPNEKYNHSLSALTSGKAERTFEDWAKRATYYDTEEITQIMVSIITSPDAPFGAKSDAIRVMGIHCSKAQLEANKDKIEAAIKDNFGLQTQFQTVLEKAE